MEMEMASNHSPPPAPGSGAPSVTTETFQKHYGRGAGYPGGASRPPAPPPPHQHQHQQYPPPSPYAAGPHAPPPPYPSHSHGHHRGGPPPPPQSQGYHPPPPWYYPPPAAAAPTGGGPNRGASRGGREGNDAPPTLVTPKSRDHEVETLPPALQKKSPASSTKRANKATSKDRGKRNPPSSNHDPPPETEEELRVDPMKQDFHFYVADHRAEAERACRRQIEAAVAKGSIPAPDDEGQRGRLLATLLIARLIRDWEEAPPAMRAAYLKREEADRKRFMCEEEVASRHCATLTARRRSPKQSGDLGRLGSFGLTEAPTSAADSAATKHPLGVGNGEKAEVVAKRVKRE